VADQVVKAMVVVVVQVAIKSFLKALLPQIIQ